MSNLNSQKIDMERRRRQLAKEPLGRQRALAEFILRNSAKAHYLSQVIAFNDAGDQSDELFRVMSYVEQQILDDYRDQFGQELWTDEAEA